MLIVQAAVCYVDEETEKIKIKIERRGRGVSTYVAVRDPERKGKQRTSKDADPLLVRRVHRSVRDKRSCVGSK